ncbi:MAG: site-2 protease family protein [Planctomycetota bacterium]
MGWSFSAGRIFGIELRIHVTFVLLLFFIFLSEASHRGASAGLQSVLFISAVFLCVLIHELGHSLIARRFGKATRSITLLPIGGMASLEEIPEKPGQEIAMSIVGPFINLAIAALLYLFIGAWPGFAGLDIHPGSAKAFFAALIVVNVMLAAFNMIPAFPMDGGRVLRGILALRYDYVRATSIAVSISHALSLFFIFFGLLFFSSIWLALIGFFLYLGSGAELQQVKVRSALHGIRAQEAMITDFSGLRPEEALSQVVERIYHGCQDDFPVMDETGLVGILTRNRILSAIHEHGLEATVAEVMDREFLAVSPRTPLEEVAAKLMANRKTVAAVLDRDRFTGLISESSIGRHIALRAAIRETQQEPEPMGTKTPGFDV